MNRQILEAEPPLAIGLPVYNGEEYLEQTVDSLLSQTYPNFSLVISDNASTDNTQRICERYSKSESRIEYHRYEKNRGAAWNFNNAFYKSSGKYFKWAAHDDLHLPQFLERCVDALESDPSIVLAFSETLFIDENGSFIRRYPYPVDINSMPLHARFRHFVAGGHIVHEVFGVIRRSALANTDMIGGYLGSDLVMLGQLALQGRYYQVPEELFLHREHQKRSMLNPQGASNATQWYDSRKTGAFVMPHWRRFWAHTIGLARAQLPLATKLKCCVEVLRASWWLKKELLYELRTLSPWNWVRNRK